MHFDRTLFILNSFVFFTKKLSFIIFIMGITPESMKYELSVVALGNERTSNEVGISGFMALSTSGSCEQSTVLLKQYLKWKHD